MMERVSVVPSFTESNKLNLGTAWATVAALCSDVAARPGARHNDQIVHILTLGPRVSAVRDKSASTHFPGDFPGEEVLQRLNDRWSGSRSGVRPNT